MVNIEDKEYQFLKKMNDASYSKLNADMMILLTNESERGAILIGTSKIEEYLEKLILTLLPSKNKNYISRLLNYPGALSSFAAKIELCYAFRIINQCLYNSLNALRKIRNTAAHSSDTFSLKSRGNELKTIYDFEENVQYIIHEISFKKLIEWKKIQIREVLKENALEDMFDKEWKQRFEDQDPLENESIQEQLIIWELVHGLFLIILKIEDLCDNYKYSIGLHDTWIDVK